MNGNFFSFSAFLAAGFLGGSVLLAQVPEASEVEALVKALSSPLAAKRASAEQALLEMGPGILPILPESVRSPEAKMRLNRVRVALERQTAEDSLDAGRISLTEPISAAELAVEVERQTQNLLEVTLPEGTLFALPEGKQEVPFWEFLDSLCDEFKLAPQTLPGKKGLRLVRSARTAPRSAEKNSGIAYLKPFRIEPVKVTSAVLLASAAKSFQIQLELAWEPRIQPVFAYLKLTEADFADASGEMLEEAKKLPALEHEILIGQKEFRAVGDLSIPGKMIPPDARTMDLRGTFSAVACGTKKDFVFDELDQKLNHEFQPVSQRTAAVLVTLTDLRSEKILKSADVSENAENLSEVSESQGKTESEELPKTAESKNADSTVSYLKAVIRYRYEEAHEAMESHRTWIYENEAVLRNASGDEIPSIRSELLRQTPNEIAVELYFPMEEELLKGLSEWELVFPRPSGIYKVEYPFELKGIPLP